MKKRNILAIVQRNNPMAACMPVIQWERKAQ
jgi:hypothetical protein